MVCRSCGHTNPDFWELVAERLGDAGFDLSGEVKPVMDLPPPNKASVAPPMSGPMALGSEIRELGDLFERGLISEEEFRRAKEKLLGS